MVQSTEYEYLLLANASYVQNMPQQSNIVCSWSECAKVHIWDLAPYIAALDVPATKLPPAAPIQTLNHKAEGYAMDWSLTRPGLLHCCCCCSNFR